MNNPQQPGKNYHFETSFGTIKLDGPACRIIFQNGRNIVGTLSWLCNEDAPHNYITHLAGQTTISAVDGWHINENTEPLVLCSGGSLRFGTGNLKGAGGQIIGEATAGELDMGDVDFPFGSNIARSRPYLRASGTGRVRASGSPQDRGIGSGLFFGSYNSEPHRITSNCRLWGIGASNLAGDYSGATNVGGNL